ncbi:MAG: hypothetical protein KatS3mg087_0510 [Patescibacteria group bacterium]|nr:MAG: hypothetical protein KatS3mg087_0510 [Patescibacteria group bacterium]
MLPNVIPLSGFTSQSLPNRAPYPDSVVMDPSSLIAALKQAPDAGRFTKEPYTDYVRFVETRLAHKWRNILYYRREMTRPYGRILLNVLLALMIGRTDFRVRPDKGYYELAKEIYAKLYQRYLAPLIRLAVADYFITGVGGISMSPLGLAPLRPENTFAFPSFFDPQFTLRMFVMDWETAKEVFDHPSLKNEPPPIGYEQKDKKPATPNQSPEYLDMLPAVVLLEKMSRTKVEYYYGNNKVFEMPRQHGYGHFLIVGETRDIHYGYEPPADFPGPSIMLEDDTYDFTNMFWVSERSSAYCELPVGLTEQLTSHYAYGYNLLEAHQKLIEAIVMRTTRSNVAAVRADLISVDDPNAKDFIDYYKPIFLLGGEAGAAPPIQFLDVVGLQEIQAGLREVENMITAITGITPYMMGLSGVSDVASEIVVMQSQANARINHIHGYIVRWLGEVVDQFGLYLAKLKPEYQEPLTAYDASTGQKVRVGGLVENEPAPTVPVIDYSDLFGRYYIEPTLVGEITNINRRNELMQALQLTMQILPVLAQLGGQIYDVKSITDHILSTFNIDPAQITVQVGQPGMPPGGVGGPATPVAAAPQSPPGAAPEPTSDVSAAMPIGG